MTVVSPALQVLHVVAALGPTNAQYHEHCLPLLGKRRFVFCSLLPAAITPPDEVTLFAGDGSRRGAWRALRNAIRHGGHDVIHAQVPGAAALVGAAAVLDPQARRRCVYSMTNSYQSYKRRNRMLLYPIFMFFPEIVLCSEAVRVSLPRPLAWLGRRRSTVIDNGVHTSRVREVVACRDRRSRPGITVVSVSRLIPIKDPLTLLSAFRIAREPEDRLVFLGDGPLREVLVQRVKELGLDAHVELAGLVPRDEVYRRVAEADVAVSASHGEGLPVAVLEAMACGCPVVLSDIEPHREIARHVPGLALVAPGDVEGFSREIRRIRGMPESRIAELRTRGREVVEERYGVATMHRRLAAVYDRTLARNTR